MTHIVLAIAAHELRLWARSPGLIAASVVPALGMGVLVGMLTLSIGMQPVALVQEGYGPKADHLAHLIEADDEAYALRRMDRADAMRAFHEMRLAAVLIVPPDFEQRVGEGGAHVELHLNNVVDVDLADDVRRSVTRSLAEFDAPQLGIVGELHGPSEGLLLPNPFRVAIAERDRRETNVSFFDYQLVPILVLIILSAGVLGTGLLTARDFERRTARMLALAPVSRLALVTGKLLGGLCAAVGLLTPVVILAVLAGSLRPPPAHWPALLLLLLALTVSAVGLGAALGLRLRRTRLTAMVGLNACAYLFFLGGGFSTVAFLPDWLKTASRLVPTTYAIAGLRQALFYPDLLGFPRDLAVLSGSAALAVAYGAHALSRAWDPR